MEPGLPEGMAAVRSVAPAHTVPSGLGSLLGVLPHSLPAVAAYSGNLQPGALLLSAAAVAGLGAGPAGGGLLPWLGAAHTGASGLARPTTPLSLCPPSVPPPKSLARPAAQPPLSRELG